MRSANSRASAATASSAARARVFSALVSISLAPLVPGRGRSPRAGRGAPFGLHWMRPAVPVAQPAHRLTEPGVGYLIVHLRGHGTFVAEQPLRLLDPQSDVRHLLARGVAQMM